jgi:hypothetical protein
LWQIRKIRPSPAPANIAINALFFAAAPETAFFEPKHSNSVILSSGPALCFQKKERFAANIAFKNAVKTYDNNGPFIRGKAF